MASTEGPMKRSIKGKIGPTRHSFMVWEMLRGTVESGGMSMLYLCPLTYGVATDLGRLQGQYVTVVGHDATVTDLFFVESVEPHWNVQIDGHGKVIGSWPIAVAPAPQSGEQLEIASRPLPNVADIADRIMEAIERDQAIHRDTLIRVIAEGLGRAPAVEPLRDPTAGNVASMLEKVVADLDHELDNPPILRAILRNVGPA